MKSGKIDLHVLASLLSVDETTAGSACTERNTRTLMADEAAMGGVGQPTDIGEPTRTG
jgi:hypothetical protein